jgi:hypothetical protein
VFVSRRRLQAATASGASLRQQTYIGVAARIARGKTLAAALRGDARRVAPCAARRWPAAGDGGINGGGGMFKWACA